MKHIVNDVVAIKRRRSMKMSKCEMTHEAQEIRNGYMRSLLQFSTDKTIILR